MLNLLKVEFYKLRTSKIFWLMILAGIGQALIGPFISSYFSTKTGEDMLFFSFGIQQFMFLIPIIGLFAYFVVCEFSTGSVKSVLAYGHKRLHIIIAKSAAFYVGVVAISFVFPIISIIVSSILNGYGSEFNLEAIMVIFRVSFLMILIYTALASLAVLFSFLFRNVVLAIGLYISLDTAARVGEIISMRNKSFEAVYSKSIFYQSNIATIKNLAFSQAMQVVVVSLITIIVSTIIAIVAFKRADIK